MGSSPPRTNPAPPSLLHTRAQAFQFYLTSLATEHKLDHWMGLRDCYEGGRPDLAADWVWRTLGGAS